MRSDNDDRLLDALRGLTVEALEPSDDAMLAEAFDLGSIARAARTAGGAPADLATFDVAAVTAAVRAEVGLPPAVPTPASVSPASVSPASVSPQNVLSLPQARPVVAPAASRARWFAAAAAVAFVGAIATMTFIGSGSNNETVLAVAELDLLGPSGGASAELVEVDGQLAVHVHAPDLADPAVAAGDGYFEVWLLNPDATSLLSLGPALDSGEYLLPAGFDPATLPVVDVSVEHFDGDPTHSGQSVLRGALDL